MEDLEDLPNELIIEICLFLPFEERFAILLVSKQFKNSLDSTSRTTYYWKKSCEQCDPNLYSTISKESKLDSVSFDRPYWKSKFFHMMTYPRFIKCEGDKRIVISEEGLRAESLSKNHWRTFTTNKKFSQGKHIIVFTARTDESSLHHKTEYLDVLMGLTPELVYPQPKNVDISVLGVSIHWNFFTSQKWMFNTPCSNLVPKETMIKCRARGIHMKDGDLISKDKYLLFEENPFGKPLTMYFDLDDRKIAFLYKSHVMFEMDRFFEDKDVKMSAETTWDGVPVKSLVKKNYEEMEKKVFVVSASLANNRRLNGSYLKIMHYEKVDFEFDREKLSDYYEKKIVKKFSVDRI